MVDHEQVVGPVQESVTVQTMMQTDKRSWSRLLSFTTSVEKLGQITWAKKNYGIIISWMIVAIIAR